MKKEILLLAALLSCGGALLSSAASPASNVDRMLGKVRANTNAELQAEDRARATERRAKLREQMNPGAPQNKVQEDADRAKDRAEYVEEKLKAAK